MLSSCFAMQRNNIILRYWLPNAFAHVKLEEKHLKRTSFEYNHLNICIGILFLYVLDVLNCAFYIVCTFLCALYPISICQMFYLMSFRKNKNEITTSYNCNTYHEFWILKILYLQRKNVLKFILPHKFFCGIMIWITMFAILQSHLLFFSMHFCKIKQLQRGNLLQSYRKRKISRLCKSNLIWSTQIMFYSFRTFIF